MLGRLTTVALALCALALAGCAHTTGDYVWVDAYSQVRQPADREYVIASGDLIGVRVYNQDGLTTRARVRDDGKISLPFLNDVQAAGMTPAALSAQLQKRLKDFFVSPVVTVSLEEARSSEIFVIGEVVKPGRMTLEPGHTLLQAIAAAGGLTQFASRDRIFVVRSDTRPVRIRFRYSALTQAESSAAEFRLRSGDTVVVE